MFQRIFGKSTKNQSVSPSLSTLSASPRQTSDPKQTFSKVFRWRRPKDYSREPTTVEVVGSFTDWRPVPLTQDRTMDAWHVTLRDVQGNRTHHYVILVDGQPVLDHSCDGLAEPLGPEEERYQLMTHRGPRVCMLFGQTK